MDESTTNDEPRRPDYRGDGIAVWLNQSKGYKYLSVVIDELKKRFVAFENR